MNTGIQDAVNLGWKLAYVLNGRGEAELLLGSYEAERRPVARAIVDSSAQRLHVAFASNTMAHVLRDIAVTVIGNLGVAQKKLQLDLSETDITYREGALVALGAPPRRTRRTDVGTRALDATFIDPRSGRESALWVILSAGRHTLLAFGNEEEAMPLDALTSRFSEDVTLVRLGPDSDPGGEVAKRYNMRSPGWVLIRPDQVIAARGGAGELAPLETYLDRVVSAGAADERHASAVD